MGTKYPGISSSGYNSSPPADDGSQVAANLITWAGVKTKLADPIKTLADAENTALVTALDLSARAISGNDTAIASDHWKTLQVTGATTITLSSAASMGAGYEVGVFNAGASTVTVTPGLASDTINNVSASVTVPIKGTMIFRTNQALTGYNVVGQSNRMDAGTISGITSFSATTGIGIGGTASGTGGVAFPAAAVAVADVNTLDDYEEGTWTPSVGGNATYTIQNGTYTKIARFVTLFGSVTINVLGTGSTNTLTGLPFAPATGRAGCVSVFANLAVSPVFLAAQSGAGSTIVFPGLTAAGAGTSNLAIFGNNAAVQFTVSYEI